jgi:TonB family protein
MGRHTKKNALLLPALTALLALAPPAGADGEDAPPPLTPPVLRSEVAAEYPPRAVEDGVEAEVVLEIDIDAEGQVEGATIVVPASPAGYGFDEAALAAVLAFEFEPAREGETPIPVRITYRYRFALAVEAPGQGQEGTDPSERSGPTERSERPLEPRVNLAGRLLERGTRVPLAGITVIVFRGEGEEAAGFEAQTDGAGVFGFFDLEPGPWRVLAWPDGYFPLRTTERVRAEERVEVTYFLERGDYNPYDVVVEGERERKEVSRISLRIEEIERVPGTFGDVLAVVQNLPGVARPAPFSGDIIVRGSAPEDTQVFVDGVSVPIIYHFGGLRSVIPLRMLEGIDFTPGNYSVQYGRGTGGLVDVNLKRQRPERVGGEVDVNLIDAGAYLEAPLGEKWSVAVAGRRSYIDGLIRAFAPDDAPVGLVTAPRYYDGQLLLSWRPDPAHELRAFVFGSDDRLEVLFDNPADIDPELRSADATTSTSFYRTLLEWRFTPVPEVRNVLRTSAGRNWIYFGIGDQFYLDLNTYVAQIRDTLSLDLGRALTLNTGFDYVFSRTDAAFKLPVTAKEGEPGGKPQLDSVRFTEAEGTDFHSIGAFLEAEARFFERLLLVPGVRFDRFSRVDQSALAPRLTARLALTERWLAKGGVGLFHQEPSFDETDAVFGNPDLGLESAWHYSAGVEFRPLPQLVLDATGFYKDIDDLVSRTTATTERDGEVVPLNFDNGGKGRVYGLELLVRHERANGFSGWVAYTLSRAERRDSGQSAWRLFDYDQTHILTLVGSYDLPRNWAVGARFRLVSGNPYTPRVGSVYVVDNGNYQPVFGPVNSERYPLFHQLDIRVDKRWVFDRWMLTAYLDLQNAYNQANTTGYSYNYDSSERRGRTGLPILPVIGLTGEF